MLTDELKLMVLNDFFGWSGGCLPSDEAEINEFLETAFDYAFGVEEDAARAYLLTEILDS